MNDKDHPVGLLTNFKLKSFQKPLSDQLVGGVDIDGDGGEEREVGDAGGHKVLQLSSGARQGQRPQPCVWNIHGDQAWTCPLDTLTYQQSKIQSQNLKFTNCKRLRYK